MAADVEEEELQWLAGEESCCSAGPRRPDLELELDLEAPKGDTPAHAKQLPEDDAEQQRPDTPSKSLGGKSGLWGLAKSWHPGGSSMSWLTHMLGWTFAYKVAWTWTCRLAATCRPWHACFPLPAWALGRLVLATSPALRPAVLRTLAFGAVLGFFIDSLLSLQPWAPIRPPACSRTGGPDPLWMLGFWISYASFVDWCLPIFGGRPCLNALLGAVFGPTTYMLGRELGAIIFSQRAICLVAAVHAVCFPLLNEVAAKSRELSLQSAAQRPQPQTPCADEKAPQVQGCRATAPPEGFLRTGPARASSCSRVG